MTDVASDPARLAALGSASGELRGGSKGGHTSWRGHRSWRLALPALVVPAAATAWLWAGSGATLPDIEAELAMLLRFMAAVKAVIAVALLALTAWRLGHPVSVGVALVYSAAVALMCASPGVIWQLAHVGIGAGLFHAGLVLFMAALIADRGGAVQLVGRALRRAHRP